MKKILFVCVENSCRSQMAEGVAKYLGKDKLEAYSAGSRPSGQVHPMAIQVMTEVGISIEKYKSKGFDDLPVKNFDYVITMGCGDSCPIFPAIKRIDWDIPDPKGNDLDSFKKTRDVLWGNITEFIRKLPDD